VLFCRFKIGEEIRFGLVEKDKDAIKSVKGSIFDPEFIITNQAFRLNQVRLLAPCQPSKVIAVGLNYTDHARELKMDLPSEPLLFIKPSTAVIGPNANILYPDSVGRLDYEAELGIVIKKGGKNISVDQAKDYILGYTCLNDVTARDLQQRDGQWTRAKSFDTFCPIGPFIATDIAAEDLDIKLLLNKEIRQSSNTKNLIFRPGYLVSFISKICSLLPGDVIATGTPSGVGPMKEGDEVEVSIQHVGSLKNRVTGERR
jgi:2-keto-4-pentenoate hydratase/2-oxohepta-3-ene-1,7-dioic acid hydratase in catechol pathway